MPIEAREERAVEKVEAGASTAAPARPAAQGRASRAVALVLAISALAILVLTLALFLGGRRRMGQARADIHNLEQAITVFHLNTERYPSALEELIMNPGIAGWNGPYIMGGRRTLHDPWDRPYVYRLTEGTGGASHVIGTYGSDGRPGGWFEAADVFLGGAP